MIATLAKNFLAYFGFELKRNQILRANKLGRFGIPKDEWSQNENGYFLKLLKITVKDESSPLIFSYHLARKIASYANGEFTYQGKKLILRINDLFFSIDFPDELFVISEVFVEHSYNFRTTDKLVVIDVGLNIGAAALFFASWENVQRVYGFELFPKTHEAAVRNFALNKTDKITSYPYGLGNGPRTMSLPYYVESKAIMGFSPPPADVGWGARIMENVRVEDVAAEVMKIHKSEPHHRKLCKLDCEGAEFEILERLFETGVIDVIDIYMIEWHGRDTRPMEDKFLSRNYQLVKSSQGSTTTGLIYAFKNNRP
jgi:FkbM family methyltransferase